MIRRLTAIALVAASACGSGEAPVEDPPTCEPGIAVPGGFEPLDSFEEPYDDRVGVRRGYRDADGRELHLLVGIPGEFGEAMTSLGDLPLTGDRAAAFYSGVEGVWTIVWDEGDVCDPRAVIGNGFSRQGFLDALEESGLVGPSPSA